MTSRIVSLVPAATEWLRAFGAAGMVCGLAAPCEAVGAPLVVRDGFTDGRRSSALSVGDPVVRDLDRDLLGPAFVRAAPDLVIVDAVDEVWPLDLPERLASLAQRPVQVFAWSPRSLRDIFEHVLRLGRQIDRLAGAMKTLGDGELRLRASHARTGVDRRAAPETLPGVVVVSGTNPWTLAGRWISELVDRAAGHALLTASGEPARLSSRDEIEAAHPTLLISMADPAEPTIPGVRTVHYPHTDRIDGAGPGIYDAIVDFTDALYQLNQPSGPS